ncbi:MAG: LysR family transcriptional regulator, partial [Sinobacteraceae bacterium]|nr:LysR family transcriptional regulator [Nevskiaceae bacterium]
MRFKGLDLNHLVTLEMLLLERHLTRASRRLNLTQPAVSHALTKLREHF